jgi:predicted DNA-binding transcriptional regulator AlpA
MDGSELLGTKEVAEMTHLAEGTLRFYRHANRGPACFTIGRRVVYRRAEVERWISELETATGRGGVAVASRD